MVVSPRSLGIGHSAVVCPLSISPGACQWFGTASGPTEVTKTGVVTPRKAAGCSLRSHSPRRLVRPGFAPGRHGDLQLACTAVQSTTPEGVGFLDDALPPKARWAATWGQGMYRYMEYVDACLHRDALKPQERLDGRSIGLTATAVARFPAGPASPCKRQKRKP
jgi:hypothetical protein